MDLATFIEDWGYLAVFLGGAMEGETVALVAGIAAGAGLLSPLPALLAGWAGTFGATQAWFVAGRYAGPRVLAARPSLALPVARAEAELEARGTSLFVFYRFLYGLRTVTPFAMGAAGVSPRRFVPVDAASWLVWLGAISALGWSVGDAALPWLETLFASQQWLLAFVVVVLLGRLIWRRLRPVEG